CMEMLEHVPDPGSVLSACARLLKPGGRLFLSTLNRTPAAFALAIVDAKLPGRSGFELSKLMRQQDPRLKILLLSGYYYEDDQPIQEGLKRGDFVGFISKPFELDEVSALAKKVLQEESLGRG
ncbi:MAG: response regulator, partial [Candidatus Methylomirabilales bacterium]